MQLALQTQRVPEIILQIFLRQSLPLNQARPDKLSLYLHPRVSAASSARDTDFMAKLIDEALGKTTRTQAAGQKIYHDREHLSYVVLPIVPRKP